MKKIVLVLLGLMLIVYPLCAVEPMIAAGSNFSVALGSDGIIYAWGTNRFGQLGDGSTQRTNDPIEVDTSGALSGKTITAIAAGYHHTVALDLDGKLYAWGSNDHDKLGGGFADFHVSPIEVKTYGDLNGKIITAIAAGYHHTVALDSDGKLYAWGNNDYGQLGDGGHGDDRDVPTEVNTSGVLSGKTITAIAAGYAHTVALDSDGKLYAWGGNEYGRLRR
ncbi:MAG: hypothetical protein U5N56_05580 [Candidatus Marinimicrobia bacterium]|nr:hypothetical protein [Candidatus Neomarinimicrobiota bacterium]